MRHRATSPATAPAPVAMRWALGVLAAGCAMGTAWATWPFDAMRSVYGAAVRAGLLERSILTSRDVDQALGRLEQLTLGPLARRG